MERGLGVGYGSERGKGKKKKRNTATLQWDMKLSGRVGNGMKIRITLYVVFEMACLQIYDLQIHRTAHVTGLHL